MSYRTDWQAWVVRQNQDGTWRVVVRSTQKHSHTMGGKKFDSPAQSYLGFIDLSSDGRFKENDSLGYMLKPHTVFPALPRTAEEAREGWETFHERDGGRSRYTAAPGARAGAGEWAFEEVHTMPWDPIYLTSARATYFFDTGRGLVGRAETANTQGYGFEGKGQGTMRLRGVKDLDAAFRKKLAAEADRYFAANKAYDELTVRANREVKHAKGLLAKAAEALKQARAKLTLPVLREQVDGQLKSHEQMLKYELESARKRAEMLGKPAAGWEAKDLAGKGHSLKGYRGKVVILDFWYRGCGWCIRAMPQVEQVARDFAGKPVVVLGMNTDPKEKDARFVVNRMKISYPVLKAREVPKKYDVNAFPTLIIIDQEGKVHDIYVGYSPTLRADLDKMVKGLLERKKG